MKSKLMLIIVSLFLLLGTAAQAAATSVPIFTDYAVPVTQNKSAPLDIDHNKAARHFRAKLELAAQQKPNFAGHYIITSWGCGAFCKTLAIIDTNNGKVTMPVIPAKGCDYKIGWWNFKTPISYMPNSRLLVITAGPNPILAKKQKLKYTNEVRYYEWRNDRLELVQHQCLAP